MSGKGKWDVIVIGGANLDYLVRGEALPQPGETRKGDTFQEAPGGKGANQAVAAARLGAAVTFMGRVGQGARGALILERLAAEGVDTVRLYRDERAPTGVALVMVGQDGEKQILTAPGANERFGVSDVEAAAAHIAAARTLLLQLEIPMEAVAAAIHLAHQVGVRIVLDPAPAHPLPDDLLRRVDIIKPNRHEAEILTGVRVTDRQSAREAAGSLLERGVGAVAIQAGQEGNLICWRGGQCWLPHIPVDSVDATGAGDAFAAALAVALAEGLSLSAAAPLANAAAALTTTRLGAQAALPRREEVIALLDRESQAAHSPEQGGRADAP